MSVRHLFCRCTQNSACTIKVFSKTPGAVQCQINEQKLQLRRISTTLKNSRLAGTFGLKMKVTRNVLRSKAVSLKHLEFCYALSCNSGSYSCHRSKKENQGNPEGRGGKLENIGKEADWQGESTASKGCN